MTLRKYVPGSPESSDPESIIERMTGRKGNSFTPKEQSEKQNNQYEPTIVEKKESDQEDESVEEDLKR